MTKNMRNKIYHLLRRSERFTKTDMVYLTKGGFWLIASHVTLTLAALVLASSFSRLLPKEIYGNYKYIITLGSLVGALSLTGIGTAVTRSVARGFEGIVTRAFKLSLTWSIGAVLISLGAGLFYLFRGNTVLAYSLFITSIGVPLLNASLIYTTYLTGKQLFKTQAQYSILTALIPTIVLIVTAYLFPTTVPVLILAYFVGHAGTAYLLYLYTQHHFKLNTKVDEEDVRFGKHASIMNILTSIAAHIDKVFLFQLIGGAAVAQYTFATAFPEQLRGVFKITNNLTHAKLSAKTITETKKSVYHKTVILGVTILFVVLLYTLIAPTLFHILFPDYMEVVIFSQVISLALIASSLGVLPLQALIANGRKRELYIYNTIAPITRIILLGIGATVYGLWGVAFAHIASKTISTLYVHMLYIRATRS